jgi:hypothetical protein
LGIDHDMAIEVVPVPDPNADSVSVGIGGPEAAVSTEGIAVTDFDLTQSSETNPLETIRLAESRSQGAKASDTAAAPEADGGAEDPGIQEREVHGSGSRDRDESLRRSQQQLKESPWLSAKLRHDIEQLPDEEFEVVREARLVQHSSHHVVPVDYRHAHEVGSIALVVTAAVPVEEPRGSNVRQFGDSADGQRQGEIFAQ